MNRKLCVGPDDQLLVTGANGFIGRHVVNSLLEHGFNNIRCLVRPSGNVAGLERLAQRRDVAGLQILRGNLLSRDDCEKAAEGVSVIFHLAAGTGKSFAASYLNSVVTTRNLLDSVVAGGKLKRFVNISSFAVYSGRSRRGSQLDESCEIEQDIIGREDAYAFAKTKQDELVTLYGAKHKVPYVIVRPGVVFGPGKSTLTGRVGIHTFGIFLHLGGSNRIPLSYTVNCAEAIVLAGIVDGIGGNIFNVVDDQLPTSRKFLREYKRNVKKMKSIYVPYALFYLFSYLWETYSLWSKGQLPRVFNRNSCRAYWKRRTYSNQKLKGLLGWTPTVSMDDGMRRYFEFCRDGKRGDNA